MVRQPTPLLWAGNRIVNEKMHLSKKLLLLLNVQKSHFSMTFNAPGIQSVDALHLSSFFITLMKPHPSCPTAQDTGTPLCRFQSGTCYSLSPIRLAKMSSKQWWQEPLVQCTAVCTLVWWFHIHSEWVQAKKFWACCIVLCRDLYVIFLCYC